MRSSKLCSKFETENREPIYGAPKFYLGKKIIFSVPHLSINRSNLEKMTISTRLDASKNKISAKANLQMLVIMVFMIGFFPTSTASLTPRIKRVAPEESTTLQTMKAETSKMSDEDQEYENFMKQLENEIAAERKKRAADDQQVLQQLYWSSATLARVMNAIALHNELLSGAVTMQQVVGELFGVKNFKSFDSINVMDVEKSMLEMSLLDDIGGAALHGVNEAFEKLTEISKLEAVPDVPQIELKDLYEPFFNISRLHDKSFIQMAFALSPKEAFKINEETQNVTEIRSLLQWLKWNMPTVEEQFSATMALRNTTEQIATFIAPFKPILQVLQRYEDVVSPMVSMKPHLNGLEHLAANYDEWAKTSDSGRAKELLTTLQKLLVPLESDNLLIGFPNGISDLELVLSDLNSAWVRRWLNHGKKLDSLKDLLTPLINLKSEFRKAKAVWSKSLQADGAKTVSASLRALQSAEKIKSSKDAFSTATLAITEALGKLTVIREYEKKSIKESMKKAIEGFEVFQNEVNTFAEFMKEKNLTSKEIEEYDANWSDQDALAKWKSESLPKRYFEARRHFQQQSEHFHEKQDLFTKVNRIAERLHYEYDGSFHMARDLVAIPPAIKSNVQEIQPLLNLLKDLTGTRLAFDSFENMLIKGKALMDGAHRIGEAFKKKAKGKLVANSKTLRNLANQMAYTRQTLEFFRNPADLDIFVNATGALREVKLPQEFQKFNESLKILARQIASIPSLIPRDYTNLKSLGKQFATLDKLSIPPPSMMKKLKKSLETLPKTPELLEVEKSLKRLEGLQYASMRQKGKIVGAMEETEHIFEEYQKGDEDDKSWDWILVIGGSIIIGSIPLVFAVYISIKDCFFGEKFARTRPQKLRAKKESKSPSKSTESKSKDNTDPGTLNSKDTVSKSVESKELASKEMSKVESKESKKVESKVEKASTIQKAPEKKPKESTPSKLPV